MDVEGADELLTTTRAVRRRLDLTRPVPREVILDAIRVSEQAPVGSNQVSRWRWLVVTDAETRATLAEIYRRAWQPYVEAVPVDELEGQVRRTFESGVFLADHIHEVPVHVVPCVRRSRRAGPGPMPNAVAASVYGSIFPSIWSFCLALRARGVGSSITTMHLGSEDEVAQLLGIPEDFLQVALLPVAYYTGDNFRPAVRPPPEEITWFERWGKTT